MKVNVYYGTTETPKYFTFDSDELGVLPVVGDFLDCLPNTYYRYVVTNRVISFDENIAEVTLHCEIKR